jgi:hypothetical protein
MSFCKFVFVSRTTPPSLISFQLNLCDNDIRYALQRCCVPQVSDMAWKQAQFGLSKGGLGLRCLVRHSSAAFVSSYLRVFKEASAKDVYLTESLQSLLDVLDSSSSLEDFSRPLLDKPPSQRQLSLKIDARDYASFASQLSFVDQLRVTACAAPRASAWLQAIPSCGPVIDMSLRHELMSVALQHRLGLTLSQPGEKCPLCDFVLDPHGHHHITCARGGFLTTRHNRIRDTLFRVLSLAGMSPSLEKGADALDLTRPADILVPNWSMGKAGAFDITVVSPLTSENLSSSGAGDHNAVEKAATLKHKQNDAKCEESGWVCVPLAVNSYGQWCDEAHEAFSTICDSLASRMSVSFQVAQSYLYNSLGIVLARQNAVAIRSRLVRCEAGAREMRQQSVSGHPF